MSELQVFRREGEYWTIVYRGVVVRLRDSKGLRYLAELLRQPRVLVPAQQLIMSQGGSAAGLAQARLAVTKRIKAAIEKIETNHAALGYHLRTAIKTGYYCRYLPEPDREMAWEG